MAIIANHSPNYGVLQFWDVRTGSLLSSLPVRSAKDTSEEDAHWVIVGNPASNEFVITRGAELKIWRLPRSTGEKAIPIERDTSFDDFAFLKDPTTVAGAFRLAGTKDSNNVVVPDVSNVVVGIMDTTLPEPCFPLSQTFSFHKRRASILTTDQSGSYICTQTQKPNSATYPLALFRLSPEGATAIPMPEVSILGGHARLSPKGNLIWTGNRILQIEPSLSVNISRTIDRKGIIDPPFTERIPRWVGNSHVVELVDLRHGTGSPSVAPERHLLLWNVGNGERAAVASAPFAKTLSASPDGTQIAEGSTEKMLRIRDATTLAEQKVLRVHDASLTAVAWHPDSRWSPRRPKIER